MTRLHIDEINTAPLPVTIEEYIAANRRRIDSLIWDLAECTPADDEEREQWIMNDERLYSMAYCEGCQV